MIQAKVEEVHLRAREPVRGKVGVDNMHVAGYDSTEGRAREGERNEQRQSTESAHRDTKCEVVVKVNYLAGYGAKQTIWIVDDLFSDNLQQLLYVTSAMFCEWP